MHDELEELVERVDALDAVVFALLDNAEETTELMVHVGNVLLELEKRLAKLESKSEWGS